MHDALRQYEPDTEISDAEDPVAQTIARSRVPTGDLTVHVMLDDGCWHRMFPDTTETACGLQVNMLLQLGIRQERKLEHPLSRTCDCWTRREMKIADDNWIKKWGGIHPLP